MKFIAVITARKGSKGIKNKNTIKINNIPLVEYTFKALSKSILKKNCFVLTDSNKIKIIAKKYSINTDYVRPASTSTDNSSSISTLKHFSKWYLKKDDYDAMILLQPTSPLRNSEDINKSIKIFKDKNVDSLFSISKHLEHPYNAINFRKKPKLKFLIEKRKKFFKRQDYDVDSYFHNGAIFIMTKKLIMKNKIFNISNHGFYIMPKLRSIELDENEDIEIIKKLLR
tara:strand:+ start:2327 stop:3007 length:681 start_codon:yes stop_codon:yes gene_type:complete